MTTPAEQLSSIGHPDLLHGKAVFLSASFPQRERARKYWETADPDELTQAIVAASRAVLAVNGHLVFGGHPTISPLVMMIAQEYLPESVESRLKMRRAGRSRVTVYQSEAFRDALPPSTRHLFEWGFAELVWTKDSSESSPKFTAEGTLVPGSADAPLRVMREQMLRETKPVGAIFLGGMEGIESEATLFRELCESDSLYFVGAPGGAAAKLAETFEGQFAPESKLTSGELVRSRNYPALMQRVVLDIAAKANRRDGR